MSFVGAIACVEQRDELPLLPLKEHPCWSVPQQYDCLRRSRSVCYLVILIVIVLIDLFLVAC